MEEGAGLRIRRIRTVGKQPGFRKRGAGGSRHGLSHVDIGRGGAWKPSNRLRQDSEWRGCGGVSPGLRQRLPRIQTRGSPAGTKLLAPGRLGGRKTTKTPVCLTGDLGWGGESPFAHSVPKVTPAARWAPGVWIQPGVKRRGCGTHGFRVIVADGAGQSIYVDPPNDAWFGRAVFARSHRGQVGRGQFPN